MYRGAALGLRVDGKLSFHQFHSLLHANKTKPSAAHGRFGAKAKSQIAHDEMDCIRLFEQFHFTMSYSAMLYRIAESFLQNSEQAKRNIRRQGAWQITSSEVNLDILLTPKFYAEASHGYGYAEILQL